MKDIKLTTSQAMDLAESLIRLDTHTLESVILRVGDPDTDGKEPVELLEIHPQAKSYTVSAGPLADAERRVKERCETGDWMDGIVESWEAGDREGVTKILLCQERHMLPWVGIEFERRKVHGREDLPDLIEEALTIEVVDVVD